MTQAGGRFWSSLPLGPGVKLISHDVNGLVAFSKPVGVLSHPNESKDEARSLLAVSYVQEDECYRWSGDGIPEKGQVSKLWLLNRLDSVTSGVILAASDGSFAQEIRGLFKRRSVRKVYQALVFGLSSGSPQVWRDHLAVEKRGGKIRAAAAGNIPAETHMRVLRTCRGVVPLTLLQLEPKTGRSHQLRVQCAKRHLPIVGDATYGDFAANREFVKQNGHKRLFLHSLETSFDYLFLGRQYHFSARAELPPEFESVFR